jgi:hypothetical protein
VPNLNVEYKEVFLVEWDNDECRPKLDYENDVNTYMEFPSTVIFDLKGENTPALSFYSRYHIDLVILPELTDAITGQEALKERVEAGEKICCLTGAKGSCLGKEDTKTGEAWTGKACDSNDLKVEQEKLDTLKATKNGWAYMINKENITRTYAINNRTKISEWFDSPDSLSQVIDRKEDGEKDTDTIDSLREDVGIVRDGQIESHYGNLLPEILIEGARPYDAIQSIEGLKGATVDKQGLRDTMRVQFVGDAGKRLITTVVFLFRNNFNTLFRTLHNITWLRSNEKL